MTFALVTVCDDDLGFIIGTWCRAMRDAPGNERLTDDDYFGAMKARTRWLTARSLVTVACHPEDRSTLLGYVVIEAGSVLHFVYVKPDVRGFGIAKALLAGHEIVAFTHWPKRVTVIPDGWKFSPFLFEAWAHEDA